MILEKQQHLVQHCQRKIRTPQNVPRFVRGIGFAVYFYTVVCVCVVCVCVCVRVGVCWCVCVYLFVVFGMSTQKLCFFLAILHLHGHSSVLTATDSRSHRVAAPYKPREFFLSWLKAIAYLRKRIVCVVNLKHSTRPNAHNVSREQHPKFYSCHPKFYSCQVGAHFLRHFGSCMCVCACSLAGRLFDQIKPAKEEYLPAFYFALRDTLFTQSIDQAVACVEQQHSRSVPSSLSLSLRFFSCAQ